MFFSFMISLQSILQAIDFYSIHQNDSHCHLNWRIYKKCSKFSRCFFNFFLIYLCEKHCTIIEREDSKNLHLLNRGKKENLEGAMKEQRNLEQVLTDFLTNIFKGILYSLMLGLVGAMLSFLMKWPLLKGSYILVLSAGVLAMFVAVIGFVGTPKTRFEFFTRMRKKNGKVEEISKEELEELGEAGVSPAVIGTVMMVIGFAIEAFMH